MEICYFKRILQLSHILCKNSSRSWNMAKPILKFFRVDPVDVFQYLSCFHIMSRSNFRFFEKKIHFFGFYAIFLKGYFREHFRALILHAKMSWETFFSSNFKKFSVGPMKILRQVLLTNLMSENKFSLTIWALEPYWRKSAFFWHR